MSNVCALVDKKTSLDEPERIFRQRSFREFILIFSELFFNDYIVADIALNKNNF